MCVFTHHFFLLLDHISETKGEIVLLCNISSVYYFTQTPPMHARQLVFSLSFLQSKCCKCDGQPLCLNR